MRYGVHVNSGSSVTDPAVLRDMAQLAEDLGFSTILIGDHVVPARQIQTPFPLKIDNPPWAVYQEHDWPDCFVTLAYLAAATQTLRLGTSVILLPYRHPAVTAKMFATIDRLSAGRLICGVGIGWMQDEFGFLGLPFAERAAMSDEYARVIKALWTDEHPRISRQVCDAGPGCELRSVSRPAAPSPDLGGRQFAAGPASGGQLG